jgi:hypothetical protein
LFDGASASHDAAFMSVRVKILLSLVIGSAFGLIILGVGIVVAGLGHGWTTPLWFSFLGPIVCPVVVFRLLNFKDRYLWFDIALLIGGVFLDLTIYIKTIEDGVSYFYRVGEFAYVWIGLWAIWQVALVIKLVFSAFNLNSVSKFD